MFVVAGVSGNTGSVVVEGLLAKGKKVRVLVRDAAKGEPFRARGAEVAVASLDDADALAVALRGAEAAYFLSPPDPARADYLAGQKAVVDAIANAVDASQVPHVVFLSSIGAQHEAGTGVVLALHDAEERFARTAAKWTFIRAAYFIENWAGSLGAASSGKLPTFFTVDRKFPMIAARDIGVLAVQALLEGPPAGRSTVIDLEAPREYSPRDIAEAAARVLGRAVEPDFAPEAAIEPAFQSFGFSPDVARHMRGLITGINVGHVAWENRGERHVRGATDLDAVVRTLLSPK